MAHDPDDALDPDPEPTPRSSIDWQQSRLTPRLVAALARAQRRIDTIGKEAWQSDQKYNYATADAVVGAVRRAFSAEGLALVTSFSHWRPEGGPRPVPDSSQRVDWHVRLDWCVLFGVEASAERRYPPSDVDPTERVYPAEAGEVAMLVGWAETVAIGGKGRPPDKSLYAARTSLSGYVALGLSAADRAIVPQSETIEDRDDADDRKSPAQVRRELDTAFAAIAQARRAHGLRELPQNRLVEIVFGGPFQPGRENYLTLLDRAHGLLDEMPEVLDRWAHAEADDPT